MEKNKAIIIASCIGAFATILASLIGSGQFDQNQNDIEIQIGIENNIFEKIKDPEHELKKLREKHGVRLIFDLENELRLNQLPYGIFGYVDVFDVQLYLEYSGMFNPEVERENWNGTIEIHKLENGEVYLIGFCNDENYIKFQQKNLQEFKLFPEPRTNYNNIIMIPITQIEQMVERNLDRGIILDMIINQTKPNI